MMFEAPLTLTEKTSVYLRLLYSRDFARTVFTALDDPESTMHESVRGFLSRFDRARLEHEQAGRIQDFNVFFKRRMPASFAALGDATVKTYVMAYCNSTEMWETKARSFLENFALWAYPRLVRENRIFEAEVLRLDGVLSGIESNTSTKSPWPGHTLRPRDGGWEEIFASRICLVDDNGAPPSFDNLEWLRNRAREAMAVRITFDSKQSTIECAPIAAKKAS